MGTTAFWAEADSPMSKKFEWDGGSYEGTFDNLVANHGSIFAFEHGGEEYYRNVFALIPFTVDGVPAEENEIIGGVHSPQRPK